MGLENLGGLILEKVLSKLEPRDIALLACVSSRLRAAASHDHIWREVCFSYFDLSLPEDPQGNPCPSFKVTYETWMRSFSMYPLHVVKRVKQCWSAIRNWLTINFPEASDTLRRGATEAEIKQAEEKLGVKFPILTRLFYRFCDGQDTVANDASQQSRLDPLGIIGGYEFYDHLVNVHLLSLSQIVKQSKEFEEITDSESKHIVVAMSMYLDKWFFLNCDDGQLYVGTKNLFRIGEMIPCVPFALVKPGTDAVNSLPQGALILWLEEHCRRLYSGMIRTRLIRESRLICLYPDEVLQPPMIQDSGAQSLHSESPPICSVAVTNGVQVRASVVFVPELSFEKRLYFHSYSIRMSLDPEGCTSNGLYYSSCQLSLRHWNIKSKDNVVADVTGGGVIGLYPHLTPDSREFVYESCTSVPEVPGVVAGSFTFVPGSLMRPEGPAFEVEVAPFILEVPEYIF
ncbi:hypothetical protein HPP92_004097 [Vanilla planifolia]|uniref:F-box protein SKIP16 n=1 Tax=Vanilla planifolia TaxID=51239 RepID=A0A835VKE9_VANPL|nr:hypothetical protein HPP92_004532 [Vanilla planifolia]KAG0504025.1 hypothetical protein HPP92_004097 [Vanilla planifolia]